MRGSAIHYLGLYVAAYFAGRALMFFQLAQGAEQKDANAAFVIGFIVVAVLATVYIYWNETR